LTKTIVYYDSNAEQYYTDTVHVDMSAQYDRFLPLVPRGGKILDAGCGSGRDSQYFKRHGYRAEAFDASSEMCRRAAALIGQPVHQKTFNDVDWVSEFDGVWACASLLHVSRDSIADALERLCRALKPHGALFASFKLRDEEWEQDGRFFNGYSEESFVRLIKCQPALALNSIWISDDARPERKVEKWLNALLQRTSPRP
jgi:SAM-dependent methyltransferase